MKVFRLTSKPARSFNRSCSLSYWTPHVLTMKIQCVINNKDDWLIGKNFERRERGNKVWMMKLCSELKPLFDQMVGLSMRSETMCLPEASATVLSTIICSIFEGLFEPQISILFIEILHILYYSDRSTEPCIMALSPKCISILNRNGTGQRVKHSQVDIFWLPKIK